MSGIPDGFADRVPLELRQHAQWVLWRFEPANTPGGKPRKVPYNARTGDRAQSNNSATWSTFELALKAWSRDESYEGAGFMFDDADGLVGVDLDNSIDIATGQPKPWAKAFIDSLNSYTEISPSGTGVKTFIRGNKFQPGRSQDFQDGKVEVFSLKRFFAVTAQHLQGTPVTIESRQSQFNALVDHVFTKPVHQARPVTTPSSSDVLMSDRVKRCMAYLTKCDPAISGQGGHNATFRAACECFRFGLDDSDAWNAMVWFNNNKTGGEPWRENELEHKIHDARARVIASGEFGIKLVEPQRQSDGKTKVNPMSTSLPGGPDVVNDLTCLNGQGITGPGQITAGDDEGDIRSTERLSQLSNARRLVELIRGRARFNTDRGRWLWFDGTRFTEDHLGHVERHAKKVGQENWTLVERARGKSEESRLRKHATETEKASGIAAMMRLAQTELGIPVRSTELDSNQWVLNCLNGTLDLKTGKLRPHQSLDLITKLAPVVFDPDAPCPRFDDFLAEITGGDLDIMEYLQRVLGRCLTGDISEQELYFFIGEGANGKSVLIDTVLTLLGDYAGTAPDSLLAVQTHQEHPTELADMMGKRLVVASETEEGCRLRVQLVKRMTGDTRMKARYMRQDFFEFDRTHKLIVVTNNKPVIHETKNAIWRRIRLVPFNVVIPEERRDTALTEKLAREVSGILAWLLRGCLSWQQDGMKTPSTVRTATDHYRTDQDMFSEFLREQCQLGNPEFEVPRPELFTAYKAWCSHNSETPVGRTAFFERIESLPGVMVGQWRLPGRPNSSVRGFKGIGLVGVAEFTEVTNEN